LFSMKLKTGCIQLKQLWLRHWECNLILLPILNPFPHPPSLKQ
jgi:hypothetical protein